MKTKLLLVILFAALINAGYGQLKDPYSFTLNGQAISPANDFPLQHQVQQNRALSSLEQPEEYKIIQFSTLPTAADREKLKEKGVTLLDYLQGNAYFAHVRPSFYQASTSDLDAIRALISILPEYKIDPYLWQDEIPVYAKGVGDKIKVTVLLFQNSSVDKFLQVLQQLSLPKPDKIDERFKFFTYEITQKDLKKLASISWIKRVEMATPPYEPNNREGRPLHKANVLNSQVLGLGYGLTGKGVKLGIWDADVEHHRDLGSRLKIREFEMHDSDHGMHTSGTIASAGILDPRGMGMAPDLELVSWNFNVQRNGLVNFQERIISLEEDGIELTSNSFGFRLQLCPSPFQYSIIDHFEDQVAADYPYFLYVFAAGNDQGICPDGFRTTTNNLKNNLVVAANRKNSSMTDFSSYGPANDGRLLPNISGSGEGVYSTFLNNGYGFMSGTSMSTPGVAGVMALLYQKYKDTYSGERPTSDLMRALATNTATDFGNVGPDYKFGYGIINGLRAAQVLDNRTFYTDKAEQGSNVVRQISVPAGAVALKVMLSWTDPGGTPGTSKALVNDLDLSVSNGGITYYPWILNPQNPSALATRGIDRLNNLEQVTINNPQSGSYTIAVKGSAIPTGAQNFAIVYDIVMPHATLTFPIGGEHLQPNSPIVVQWTADGVEGPFNVEYSKDGGTTYAIIASNLPSETRSFVWTIPENEITSMGRIRVSSRGLNSESKGNFHIMRTTSITNEGSSLACGVNGATLTWLPIAGAKYEIMTVEDERYVVHASTSNTSYTLTNLESSDNSYFAVRAIDINTGAVSERSTAVRINPIATAVSLPFEEDFNRQRTDYLSLTSPNGSSRIAFINDVNMHAVFLSGPAQAITPAWDASATLSENFDKNSAYVSSATICDIDASSVVDNSLRLSFDFRQIVSQEKTSAFRVVINGAPIASTEGITVYGEANTPGFKTQYYDISGIKGGHIKVEFEAISKSNSDVVNIDNVQLYIPETDVELRSMRVSNDNPTAETIEVQVYNHSATTVRNVPISLKMVNKSEEDNTEIMVEEVIAGPIEPLDAITYKLKQKVNHTIDGLKIYTVTLKLEGDVNVDNDSQTLQYPIDNTSKRMVFGMNETIQACELVITDDGGRYGDYTNGVNSTLKVVPEENKIARISFSHFDLEDGYDFFDIFDEQFNPIERFTGSSLPPSVTAAKPGQGLILSFRTDGGVTASGFIAHLECVDLPQVDLGVSEIVSPSPLSGIKGAQEAISFIAEGYSVQNITSFDALYSINDGEPIRETFERTQNPQTFTFAQAADLSMPGDYTLRVWLELENDENPDNDQQEVNIQSLPQNVDLSVTLNPNVTIIPFRTRLSPVSVIVRNTGTQPANGFSLSYAINGDEEVVTSYDQTIQPNSEVTVGLDLDLTAPNRYNIEFSIINPDDANDSNNTHNISVYHSASPQTNVTGNMYVPTRITSLNQNQFNLNRNFTIEFWVKPGETKVFGELFSKGNIRIVHHRDINTSSYNLNSLIIVTPVGLVNTSTNSIVPNMWQHIALASSADGVLKIYINGNLQNYINARGIYSNNANNPIELGSPTRFPSNQFTGAMDEVRVWNYERSAEDVAAFMANSIAPNSNGLLAYYKFNELSGEFLFDYSANDNTAIIFKNPNLEFGAGQFWDGPGDLLSNVSVELEVIPTEYNASTRTYNARIDAYPAVRSIFFDTQMRSTLKVDSDLQHSGVTTHDLIENPTIRYTLEGVGINAGIVQHYELNTKVDGRNHSELLAYSFESRNNSSLSGDIRMERAGNKFYRKVEGLTSRMLKATFNISQGAKLFINGIEQMSPQTIEVDYSQPVFVTVYAENERDFTNYSIDLDSRSNANELLAFDIDGQIGNANFDYASKSVTILVKPNVNLAQISPTFVVSDLAKLYAGSVEQRSGFSFVNLTKPIHYTVVAEDNKSMSHWTISTVVDNVKPVITLIGKETIYHEMGTPYMDQGATAMDNVDGDITDRIIVDGSVNTNASGTYQLTYNVTDRAGNAATPVVRTIKVDDTEKPVITLKGDNPLIMEVGTTYVEPGFMAIDNVDGDITNRVEVIGNVDTRLVGTYELTYTVSDARENRSIAKRQVQVIKATANIQIGNLKPQFTGAENHVTVTVTPSGVGYDVTYNGSPMAPKGIGRYEVVVTINDPNYSGQKSAVMEVTLGATVGDANSKAYIYSSGSSLYIQIKEMNSANAQLKIFNRAGALLFDSNTVGIGTTQINRRFADGVYIVNLVVDGALFRKNVIIIN